MKELNELEALCKRLESSEAPECLLYSIEQNKGKFNLTIYVIGKEIKLANKTLVQLHKKLFDILPKLKQYEKHQMKKLMKDKDKDK